MNLTRHDWTEERRHAISIALLAAHKADGAVEVEYRANEKWAGWVVLNANRVVIEEYDDEN